ncbi:hypothetical protein Tcan_13460 [Toxocara canis]|uniref:Ig-like domain-containing protein n=1 Tax=Toxocara canis TaxID=6265 RepID=A0A0B2VQI3_TOXCA|nr:hypothetical protein Tcan_13460 [Toxocara canis]
MQASFTLLFALTLSYILYSSGAATKKDRYDILLTKAGKRSEPSESRFLEKGSNFVITCQLDDNVTVSSTIVWMHNDIQSPVFNNVKIKQSPRRLRIVINSFGAANVGFYSCKTSDGKARSTRRVRLLERCPDAFSGYCHNGGECVWDGTGAASCFCAKGFLGKRCEKIISSLPVMTDQGNITSLTVFLTLLSIVLLIGVILGIAAIRYRLKRTHDMKSRSTNTTNSVKVAAICPEYNAEIQKKPLILNENTCSSAEKTTTSPNDDMEQKRPKRLLRSDAVEEV